MDNLDLIERGIDDLLKTLNGHAKTRQQGPYRVRIHGPFDMTSTPMRWTVAVEPYNDFDFAEGLGTTLSGAVGAATIESYKKVANM